MAFLVISPKIFTQFLIFILIGGVLSPATVYADPDDGDATPSSSPSGLWKVNPHQAKAEEILARLVNANHIKRSPTIWLNSTRKTKNAYASDNDIHITRGILSVIRSDDEFAALISHELAHCVLQHSRKMDAYLYRHQRKLAAEARNAQPANPYATVDSLSVQERAQDFEQQTLPSVTRGFELKADRLGLMMMHKAGYNVDAFSPMMTRLTGASGGQGQSHPSSVRRQQEAEKLALQLKALPAEAPEERIPKDTDDAASNE